MQHSELSGACRRSPGTYASECGGRVKISSVFLGNTIYRCCGCGNTLAVQYGYPGIPVLVNDYPDPAAFEQTPLDPAKELRCLAAHYRMGVGQPGYGVIADHLDDIAGELETT